MAGKPRPAGAKPHCRVCNVETDTTGHAAITDDHPQPQTQVGPGAVRHFTMCPGGGMPALWLVPQEVTA